MVCDNQLDQYFQFVKDMLLDEVISEPLMDPAYYANQNLLSIQDLVKLMQRYSLNRYLPADKCLWMATAE